ncbi:MAG: hypothetical protein U0610_12025 [bacterium]
MAKAKTVHPATPKRASRDPRGAAASGTGTSAVPGGGKRSGAASPSALVAKLTAKTSATRTAGLAMLVDFVLDQPARSFIDAPRLSGWVTQALTAENAARVVDEHVQPAWKRHVARAKKSRAKAGDLVTVEARQALERILTQHPGPRTRWADDAVDPRLLALLLAPVLEELLLKLARRLPVFGGATADFVAGGRGKGAMGLGGMLRATVEKRAGQFMEAGRAVLGGLGVDIEHQIRVAAAELGQAATDELREAFTARLKSKEGRAILAKIQSKAISHVLETSVAEISATVEPIPWADVKKLAAAFAEHARGTARFAAVLREEIAAALAVVGARSVGELLEEAGLRDRVRADLLAQGEPIAKRFFAAPAFAHWLGELLAD